RNIRALNGRFNTSITHAYSIVIGSKHITLNATEGGFLTASKQFRHGATSKSRSNTASNSTKHKSPHLSGFLGSSDSLVFSELFHSLAPRPLAARSISDFLLTYLAT